MHLCIRPTCGVFLLALMKSAFRSPNYPHDIYFSALGIHRFFSETVLPIFVIISYLPLHFYRIYLYPSAREQTISWSAPLLRPI